MAASATSIRFESLPPHNQAMVIKRLTFRFRYAFFIVTSYNKRMTCSPAHVANQIRNKGFRLTHQRMAILNVLYDSGGHLTPTEIFERLQTVLSGATEPTVYRNLDFLRENGLIRATHSRSGRLQYEIVTHLHHHLVCKACGQEIEVKHEQLQPLYDQLEQSTGYRLTENHFTFMGYCPHCKEKGE